MPNWSPQQYEKFDIHRGRPFVDLISRVLPQADPTLVLDLGCGNGPLTLTLADRWSGARIVGIDSSASMLERARALDADQRVEWRDGDLTSYDITSDGEPDVIVTNATLQWVPTHPALIPGWIESLSATGWFAMQVPGNFDAPSHRILRGLTREVVGVERAAELTREAPVGEPSEYAVLLADAGLTPDVWETTYVQVLDPNGAQDNPVLEWMKGTALRPVLDALGDDADSFLTELDGRLARAYPRTSHGVLFPFRRIFAVGHKTRGRR